jgi:hypothetical protein
VLIGRLFTQRHPGTRKRAASRPATSHSTRIRPSARPITFTTHHVQPSGSSGYTPPSRPTPVEQRTAPAHNCLYNCGHIPLS